MPAGQGAQTGAVVPEPGLVCTVPAAQVPFGTHVLWFGIDVYDPDGQVLQT